LSGQTRLWLVRSDPDCMIGWCCTAHTIGKTEKSRLDL